MYSKAAQAYGETSRQTVQPRDLEASILIKAAARLQGARDEFENDRSVVEPALNYNRKLWTFLMDAVSQQDNPLPDAIRQNILNLGLFVMNQSIQTQIQPTRERLTSLITINREIAAGLRARAQAEAETQQAASETQNQSTAQQSAV